MQRQTGFSGLFRQTNRGSKQAESEQANDDVSDNCNHVIPLYPALAWESRKRTLRFSFATGQRQRLFLFSKVISSAARRWECYASEMLWLPRYLAAILVLGWICLGSVASADRARARALVTEGKTLAQEGQREEALRSFERAIQNDDDYIPAYESALPLWLALGRFQEAQLQLESLTLRCGDCSFAWYALGALYRKAARYDLAALAYEAYLSKRPKDADAHFGLAMAFTASKDARARRQLARYLELEQRPERDAYRARALVLLREFGDGAENSATIQIPLSADPIPGVASLVKAGRLASAEGLLWALGRTDSEALFWHLKIAERRGQWFHSLGYRLVLRLYRLGP